MRAVEDGDLVERNAVVFDEGADALQDKLGLFPVVHGLDDEWFLRVGAMGAELFLEVAAFGLGSRTPLARARIWGVER